MEKVLRSNGGSGLGVDTSEMSRDARKPPTAQEWEGVKAIIYDLYVKQDLPLKDVQVEMARRGHIAR